MLGTVAKQPCEPHSNTLKVDTYLFPKYYSKARYQGDLECQATLLIPEVSIADEGVFASVCSSVNNAILSGSCGEISLCNGRARRRMDRLGSERPARMCMGQQKTMSLEASLLCVASIRTQVVA